LSSSDAAPLSSAIIWCTTDNALNISRESLFTVGAWTDGPVFCTVWFVVAGSELPVDVASSYSGWLKGIRGHQWQFSCDVCKISFTSRYNLERHAKAHTGEKPFCCQVCKERFSLCSSQVMHLRFHNGERKFLLKFVRK
jgi:hypothetical protein